jgi:hypothetical protein
MNSMVVLWPDRRKLQVFSDPRGVVEFARLACPLLPFADAPGVTGASLSSVALLGSFLQVKRVRPASGAKKSLLPTMATSLLPSLKV